MFIETVYASEGAAETTSESADQGVLASLGINPSLLVFQLINFAIVVAVLWFLILKPLTKKIAERQKTIDESLENAKKVQETLANADKTYQEKVQQAKKEASLVIEKAQEEAIKAANDVKIKAKQEIEAVVAQTKKKIQVEKEQMVVELKKETAGFIVMALEKLLGEKMDSEEDKRLIEEELVKLEDKARKAGKA